MLALRRTPRHTQDRTWGRPKCRTAQALRTCRRTCGACITRHPRLACSRRYAPVLGPFLCILESQQILCQTRVA